MAMTIYALIATVLEITPKPRPPKQKLRVYSLFGDEGVWIWVVFNLIEKHKRLCTRSHQRGQGNCLVVSVHFELTHTPACQDTRYYAHRQGLARWDSRLAVSVQVCCTFVACLAMGGSVAAALVLHGLSPTPFGAVLPRNGASIP